MRHSALNSAGWVLALALLLLSCEGLGAGRAERRVPEGDWGGEHVSLQVTAKGGTLEFDCAHGTIGGELVLDASGRFDVPGVYAEERGGPVREDAPASGLAVRYSGRVKGSTMRLIVTRTDTGERLGTYALTLGLEPGVVKCR